MGLINQNHRIVAGTWQVYATKIRAGIIKLTNPTESSQYISFCTISSVLHFLLDPRRQGPTWTMPPFKLYITKCINSHHFPRKLALKYFNLRKRLADGYLLQYLVVFLMRGGSSVHSGIREEKGPKRSWSGNFSARTFRTLVVNGGLGWYTWVSRKGISSPLHILCTWILDMWSDGPIYNLTVYSEIFRV